VLVALVALAGSAEFFGYLYLRHVVRLDWQPAWMGPSGEDRRIGAWRVPHPAWGNWRLPNVDARHESACFSVALHSNAAGARDQERALEGAGRTVVLGDSFAEGWGVEDAERVSNLLEARTGHPFMNFAAASHGPLQYQLIYEQLASRYQHDGVLVFLLADNDFTDNDFAVWKSKAGSGGRVRPYYERLPDGTYRPFYPVKPEEGIRRQAQAPGFWASLGNTIRTNSWALRTGQHVGDLWRGRGSYSGYFDVTDPQLDAVAWSLGEIKRAAGERPVTVALIPRLTDFQRAGTPNLPARLEARLRPLGITMVDLLPALRKAADDPASLYLRCDGHWTIEGNRVAAEALLAAGVGR